VVAVSLGMDTSSTASKSTCIERRVGSILESVAETTSDHENHVGARGRCDSSKLCAISIALLAE
jgi:hypothetical protein